MLIYIFANFKSDETLTSETVIIEEFFNLILVKKIILKFFLIWLANLEDLENGFIEFMAILISF